MSMEDETAKAAAEVVGAAVGSKATYAGAGVSAASWWLSSEAGVVIGFALGVLGLIVNIYFRRKDDKRKQEMHQAQLDAIRGACHAEQN